jgi:hypothetical protein
MRFDPAVRMTRVRAPAAWRLVALALSLAGAPAAGAPAAGAQATFARAGAPPDFARYESPDACVVAVHRVALDAEWSEWRDTLPYDPAAPLPAAAAEAAQRCAAHFPLAEARARDLPVYVELALLAGDDAGARAALDRRLAAAGPADAAARARVLQEAVRAYLDAQPARVEAAEACVRALDSLGATAATARRAAWGELFDAALAAMDTARFRRVGDAWLALAAAAPASVKQTRFFVLDLIKRVEALSALSLGDSSTSAVAAMARARVAAVLGVPAAQLPAGLTIGRRAPPLRGEYWFGRTGTGPRPAPGKVALLYFVEQSGARPAYDAIVRRVAQRFGDRVEITLVARTVGEVDRQFEPEPAGEAEATRRYLIDQAKLPGALVVATAPFARRPAPDGRIIEERAPNVADYARLGANRAAFVAVVDQAGYIARELDIDPPPRNERALIDVIERLLRRGPTS